MLWSILLFSHPVIPDSLQHCGLQQARTPNSRVCPSSCSLQQWCGPAISSSDALFYFCPQSSVVSETFPMSRLFTSDDQNTGALASASVLPMSEYSGLISFKMDWLTSLLYKGLSGVFSSTTVQRHLFIWRSAFFMVQVSQPYMTTEKTIALTIWTSIDRVMSLLFDTLSRFVIAFLPRSNCLLISWLQSPFTVILEPRRRSLSLLPPFPLLFAL